MGPVEVVLIFAALVFGSLFGWLANSKIRRGRLTNTQEAVHKLISEAREEAEALKKTAVLEARDEWRLEREVLEKQLEGERHNQRELEAKLHEREHQLDRKVDVLESKERTLNKMEHELEQREANIATQEIEIGDMIRQQHQHLELLAGINQAEARQMLIDQQVDNAHQFAARKVREIKDTAIAEANRQAKEIITQAIQRFAAELAVESTVSVVNIPSEDMKGRIIGRDGRNIRSFEMMTGVEVIVDDTPGMVMLSGFDPLRREVARNTLAKLIVDGRIHPGRIEEVYEKAVEDVEELVRESGSKAAFDLGLHDLGEPLLELLGQLRFRTSYGQNILAHSKEVGILAGMMAEELGLDMPLARRAGLLHDISKAISHEVNGDPAQASAALARKSGENAEVIQVIETHSMDSPARTVIGILVEAANQISINRPGAQKDKIEEYTRRLHDIEEVATTMPGVLNAYALQNGKEIRVIVDSALVDDAYADQLADEIAEKIEKDLDQPGQIKVHLVREVRAVHIAR